MKHKPILLLCLLVGPALARPNAAPEPIYYRSSPQSNPLEVTEELIPTTLAITSSNDQDQPQDMPKALELKGTTTTTTTTTTEVPVTTTAAQDQNSRYTKYAEPDVLSSESIIKDFFLKNLANFQKESGNLGAIPSLVEEPNTLRSVSLTGPTWGDPGPDPQYGYTNVRKKPVIHKIITKWSDKTQDAFNVDFTGQHGIVTPGHLLGNFAGTTGFIAFPTATPVPVIIVAKPVYPENQQLSLLDNGYSPEPVRDVVYGSAEPQNDVYGESGYSPEPVRDVVYGSDPQNDVYEPLNDGYQVQQDPIDSGYAEPPKQASKKKKKKNKNKTKKPEKQQQTQMSDPDRPDAAYFNDQVEQFEPSNGWNTGQDDPYEEKDPYADALGALKDQPVIECNGIRISVNGKEACDEIEVTINRVDEITKNGFVPPPPLIPPVVPVASAAADSVPAAAGNAAAVAADPVAAVAPPVANDASLFAAPLDPLASIPAVPPPLPGPISFLTSPIGNLMNNLVQPTRLGTGPGTSGGNKHKHKPHHDHDSTVLSDDSGGGGGMLTDTSHALFGMLAALSAMTPMNIIVMALASLPVMALVMAGVGAGMYMYSKFTPPIKNYSTIVVKRPLPVVPASIQHHHRYRQPVKASASSAIGSASSSGWFDFGDMWNNIGWTANDRRGVGKVAGKKPTGSSRRPSSRVVQPAYRLSPYRGHGSRPEAKSKMATTATTTTKRTGRRPSTSPLFKRPEAPLKTKVGTSGGYVVSTSTKILTSAGLHHQGSSQGKANDVPMVHYEMYNAHAGVAEPVSEEEDYHGEVVARPSDRGHIRMVTTTTPKEGLSTWVLLSGSNSVTSTESKKEIVNTTKRPFTSTTKRPATTSARKPLTTARRRPMSSTRTTPAVSQETNEKINKLMSRLKVVAGALQDNVKQQRIEVATVKSEPVMKKAKKTTTTTSTTTTTTTTTPAPTTTELATTEVTATDDDENAVETSTFLILEPKDAMFDLPEDRSPSKTTKKKTSRKPTVPATKKKTATKKKKPEEKDSGLIKLSEKRPPAKNKPISAQIMNYLSREVMPTVGVGLVGLVITAGLASYFLGTPLTAALRRSDETNRKDDVYYSNYEDYAGQDGQNEEEVFGKLIAGMPDRSSYYRNNLRRRTNQPLRTGHQYGNYHVQSYSANKYPQINYRNRAPPAYAGTPEMYATYNRNVQAKSHNEFFYNTPPSFYTKPSSPVYVTPETTTTTTQAPPTTPEPNTSEMADEMSEEHELLPNPAAYTAEHSPEQHAHYDTHSQFVVGGYHQDNSMMDIITSAPVPEHGPRRRRRQAPNSAENELDNEVGIDEKKPTTTESVATTTATDKFDLTPTPTTEHTITWQQLLRNTVEMKIAMGVNLLQQVTSEFQKYLTGVQHRVEQAFNGTATAQ